MYNLDEVPIEILTDAEAGDGHFFKVWFWRGDPAVEAQGVGEVGGLDLQYDNKGMLQYRVRWCTYTAFTDIPSPGTLPADKVKLWRITLTKDGTPKLLLECNDVEVLNLFINNDLCENPKFGEKWSTPVRGVSIKSQTDVNIYYRCKFLRKMNMYIMIKYIILYYI